MIRKWVTLPATRYELGHLAGNLRKSDRDEVLLNAQTFGRWRPGWTLEADLSEVYAGGSPVWAIWCDDLLVAIGGVVSAPGVPGTGAIWMLGTPLADKLWRGMTARVRAFVAAHLSSYSGGFGNVVPASMSHRVRWMEHLGFDIIALEAEHSKSGHVLAWIWPPPRP